MVFLRRGAVFRGRKLHGQARGTPAVLKRTCCLVFFRLLVITCCHVLHSGCHAHQHPSQTTLMHASRKAGEFWSHIVESAQNTTVSYSVVINPSSGPGDSAEDAYTTGINELLGVGVEVCLLFFLRHPLLLLSLTFRSMRLSIGVSCL